MAVRYMPRTKPQQIKPSSSSSVSWDDVAGVEEAKDELREVVEFLRDPKRFRKLGARVPKGILLHGPPGTGKTLLAKAVANESKRQLLRAVRARRSSRCSSASARRASGACSARRARHAPAIIFIDELDAVGATRGKDISGEKDQTLNQLLVELDGFGDARRRRRDRRLQPARASSTRRCCARAASTARSSSRRPTSRAAAQILDVHTRGQAAGDDVDLELVARQTSGLTGADLANICNEAAIFAGRERRDAVDDAGLRGRARAGRSPACSRAA